VSCSQQLRSSSLPLNQMECEKGCCASLSRAPMSARREARGRRGPRAASARGGKSKALHTVAETGTGMGGGAACEARVFLEQAPRLRRGRHAHAAVCSHATEVRPLRTTRTPCKVKREYCEQTEPSLASNLLLRFPGRFEYFDHTRFRPESVATFARNTHQRRSRRRHGTSHAGRGRRGPTRA
jgi:hypothetical protein